MAKKILITGVNGFLGKALWEYIKAKQFSFEVFGVDHAKLLSSRRLFLCDVSDKKDVLKIIYYIRPDYIFHLSGGRMNAEKELLRNNILATRVLLEVVNSVSNYCPRIIIPGSAAEYGRTVSPVRETALTRPVSFYGLAKNTQTNLGLMYARTGLDVVVGRIFNVCGYGTPPTLSLGHFSREIALIEKSKKRLVIQTRNLRMKRDFLDIKDVCSALLKVAQGGKSGEIYNICSGNSFLMRDLLNELIGYSQVDNIAIKEDNESVQEVDISVGSNTKIKKVTGWKPKVTISQSLKSTLRFYRDFLSKGQI